VLDWVLEFVIYGGGCALLVFILGFFLLGRFYFRSMIQGGWIVVAAMTMVAFLLGGLFGERGVNWVGSLLRQWEDENY
jgi:hypothetical protein